MHVFLLVLMNKLKNIIKILIKNQQKKLMMNSTIFVMQMKLRIATKIQKVIPKIIHLTIQIVDQQKIQIVDHY